MDCTFPLALRRPVEKKRAHWYQYIIVVWVSLLGGLLGIAGAFVSEVRAGGFLLGVFIGAPVIEEAFKPIGVFLSLLKWPQVLQSRLFTAICSALGGLVFGLLEAVVYLYVYVPDHSEGFAIYRWTVGPALHTTCSFLVGLGLDRRIVDVVNRGDKLPKRTRNFYLLGVAIHAIFNTTVTIIAIAGVDFN